MTIKKVENNEKYPINFSLFKDIFDENIEINDLIDEYNDTIYEKELYLSSKKSKNKWIIEFPFKIIYKFMKDQADLICEIINNILAKENIRTIIFVGGYCYNELLLELIKKRLNKNLIYLQPSRPCLAIMEGAVLFGKKPSIIDVRKAKYTIGISIKEEWDEKKHSEKGIKVYEKESDKYFCLDCFSKFIEINQNIKLNDKIKNIYNLGNKRYCNIRIFKTFKRSPTYIFEKGIIFIGNCELDAGKDYEKCDREIEVSIKFGGTFIEVEAIHIKSGNKVNARLIFN